MYTVVDIRKKHASVLTTLDLDLLLAHSIGRSKEFIFSHPEYRLTFVQRSRWAYFFWLYRRVYSVAAITHHKEFYGLDFCVNKHVLIPRPETETLVDEAVKAVKNLESRILNQGVTLIDVGTGSGCIPIAILKTIEPLNNRAIRKFAIDISKPALHVAKKNAQRHGVQITFLQGNLLTSLVKYPSPLRGGTEGGVLVITANLPYLTKEQCASEPSIQREPRSALVADNDGLALYEQLLQQIVHLISLFSCSRGTPPWRWPNFLISVFLEIDPSQSTAITLIIKKYLPQASVEIKKDLAGKDRVVIIRN